MQSTGLLAEIHNNCALGQFKSAKLKDKEYTKNDPSFFTTLQKRVWCTKFLTFVADAVSIRSDIETALRISFWKLISNSTLIPGPQRTKLMISKCTNWPGNSNQPVTQNYHLLFLKFVFASEDCNNAGSSLKYRIE